jgi:hypothetical protein
VTAHCTGVAEPHIMQSVMQKSCSVVTLVCDVCVCVCVCACARARARTHSGQVRELSGQVSPEEECRGLLSSCTQTKHNHNDGILKSIFSIFLGNQDL